MCSVATEQRNHDIHYKMSATWIYQTFSDPKLLTPEAMAWLSTFVPKEQVVMSTLPWHHINAVASNPDRQMYLDAWLKLWFS